MAMEVPDPRSFQSWDEAFQLPIPVVRKLEQQLRASADENRERLRSLVGASYRSLLDTAETIIDMEASIGQVESKLAVLGQACNTRNLDRRSEHAVKMHARERDRDQARFTYASQLAVLHSCPVVMKRLLKKRGSVLLIAKVLVVSRLLHKALSQNDETPPIVDQLWARILSARRKLLRRVDSSLSGADTDHRALVESMSAYALVTNSTPTDVLKHFLKTRQDRMLHILHSVEKGLASKGRISLTLCIQSCTDAQPIFPRQLAESLGRLKAQPLIQDPDLRSLFELRLDVHDRWLGDEARSYTPWPRHNELMKSEAERLLQSWSKVAITAYLDSVKVAAGSTDDLHEIASFRSEVIETWLLSGWRMNGVKFANVLDDIRDVINQRMELIVRQRTNDLASVLSAIEKVVSSGDVQRQGNGMSLWSIQPSSFDLSHGADTFKGTICTTQQGHDAQINTVRSIIDEWIVSVLQISAVIKSMKEARWNDLLMDVEHLDDDDLGDSKQNLLSSDDPRSLEVATQEALSEALQKFGHSFGTLAQRMSDQNDHAESAVQRACFLLRVAREVNDKILALKLQENATTRPAIFTSDSLQPLLATISAPVVHAPVAAFEKSLAANLKVNTNSHVLWEGRPALPTQPSPSAFGFLQRLTRTMASYGADLWSLPGVTMLKSVAAAAMVPAFDAHLKGLSQNSKPIARHDNKGNAAATTEDNEVVSMSTTEEETRQRRTKQLFFDVLYMQRFLIMQASPSDETALNDNRNDAFEHLVQALTQESSLDEACVVRLSKSASEYRRKTYLLFALLA